MCYKLTEAAIQAGHIRNLSNPKVGESAKSGTLEINLDPMPWGFSIAALVGAGVMGVHQGYHQNLEVLNIVRLSILTCECKLESMSIV